MQGLSWLFNAFRGQSQAKPQKPRATPKPRDEEELLSKQPTHITPVVETTPSRSKLLNSLSEDELQNIIRQLEAVQKDPKNAEKLDLSLLKNLQANNKAAASNQLESVQIITAGSAGSRSRLTTRSPQREESSTSGSGRYRGRKATTIASVSVSNDIDDVYDYSTTTDKPRLSLPPVKLTPIPGVPEKSDPKVRGQLINAAVNVTKAISSFLGTALQVSVKEKLWN